jgi:hypothetical protein
MAFAIGGTLTVEWKYELHLMGATKFPMAGDFGCCDKAPGVRKCKPHRHGRFLPSCNVTRLCQARCPVHRQTFTEFM